jgi:hypothetical protein
MDGYILMSVRQECRHCKRYFYDYDTGNTGYAIGERNNIKEFGYGYNSEKSLIRKENKDMNEWIRKVRSEWRKYNDTSGNPIIDYMEII